jgi:hypothetical protein
LSAYVGDQPVAGFGVETRQVAGVGIAVGVAVLHVEQQDEVVAMVQAHVIAP